MTINLTTGFKEGLNRDAVAMAKGIYKLPAFVPQFARGRDAYPRREGEIQGPGTPTSDEIPAMLSDKEAVLNAGAVEHVKDKFGDGIIKQWNAEYAPEGARTKVHGGVLRAAEGMDWGDNPKLYEQLQRARAAVNQPTTHGFGPGESPSYTPPIKPGAGTYGLGPGNVAPGKIPGPSRDFFMYNSANKQLVPVPKEVPKAPGTSLVPAGGRTGSRYTRVGANEFVADSGAPKITPESGFTVEPSTNPAGTMQANKALVPRAAGVFSKMPGLSPNIVDSSTVGNVANAMAKQSRPEYREMLLSAFPEQTGEPRKNSIAAALKGYSETFPKGPGMSETYAALRDQGYGAGIAAPAAIGEAIVQPGLRGIRKLGSDLYNRSVLGAVERANLFATPADKVTPPSNGAPVTAKPSKAPPTASQNTQTGQSVPSVEGTPSDPNIYGPGGKNYGSNPTAEQVKELFGGAEGQAPKTPEAVEEYKKFLQAQGEFNDRERTKQAIDFANYGQVFPGTNPAGRFAETYTPQQIALEQQKLAADEARGNRPAPVEYAAAGDSVIQKTGQGAAEFNQRVKADAKRKEAMRVATWGTLLDPKASEEDKSLATQYLQVLDPQGLTTYLQKQF